MEPKLIGVKKKKKENFLFDINEQKRIKKLAKS